MTLTPEDLAAIKARADKDPDSAAYLRVPALLADLEAAEARASAAERELQHYKDREAHFAEAMGLPDGGRYRNDWDARLRRALAAERERDEARRAALMEAAAITEERVDVLMALTREAPDYATSRTLGAVLQERAAAIRALIEKETPNG